MSFAVFRRRHAVFCRKKSYKMRHIVESDRITDFGHLFIRIFENPARGVEPVFCDELRECHPFLLPEIGAKSRAVHSHLLCNIIQCDIVYIVRHDILRDMLHSADILFDTDRFAGRDIIRFPEYGRQQAEHLA